jgi:tRNA A-37 threonylcarbamoyl transferase component Bud32
MQDQPPKAGQQPQSNVKLDHAQVAAGGNVHVGHVIRHEQHIHQAAEDVASLERKIQTVAEKLEKTEDSVLCRSLLKEMRDLSEQPVFNQLKDLRKYVTALLQVNPDEPKSIQSKAQALTLAIFSQHHLILHRELTVGDPLGQGSFGKVYLAQYKRQRVAIKEIFGEVTANAHKALMEEIRIMFQLNSDFIVRLHGISVDKIPILVMECMSQGSLTKLLGDDEIALTWFTRYQIAHDVACGLDVLHTQKIIHRDLKSMNVLLCHKDQRYWAKISDFGLSQVKSSSRMTSAGQAKSVGTTAWKAPELFGLKPKYSSASDIYAYAMVLWEIAARALPFIGVDESEIKAAIKEGERADIPENCPEAMRRLIERLWDQKPERRLTTSQIIAELEPLLAVEAQKEAKEDGHPSDMLKAMQAREEEMLAKQSALEAAAEEKNNKIQALEAELRAMKLAAAQVEAEQPEKAKAPEQRQIDPLAAGTAKAAAALGQFPAPKPNPPQNAAGVALDEKEIEVSEADKQTFFRHIARGEQDQAEAMLKEQPVLALAKGRFDDISDLRCLKKGDQFERVFQNISGWQYAIWAGDIHMCRMIKQCLLQSPDAAALVDTAKTQYRDVRQGKGDFDADHHRKAFDLTPLIDALKAYVQNLNAWDAKKCEAHWCKVIGGHQRKLPAHVINEYCRPDRSFVVNHGPPDFLDLTLPRVGYKDGPQVYGLDWFLTEVYSNGKMGESWAASREQWKRRGGWSCVGRARFMPLINDMAALDRLKNVRRQQIEAELKNDLETCMRPGGRPGI